MLSSESFSSYIQETTGMQEFQGENLSAHGMLASRAAERVAGGQIATGSQGTSQHPMLQDLGFS